MSSDRGGATSRGESPVIGASDGPVAELDDRLDRVRLVDHHVHGILRGGLERATFLDALIESNLPAATAAAGTDTQLWYAVRRWCAPLLGLPPGVDAETYLERRLPLTNEEAAARMLPSAGFGRLLVETGYRGDLIADPAEMAALARAPADPVVRLEAIAERLALGGIAPERYGDAFRAALEEAFAGGAVATKTILAYRGGFDRVLDRPTDAEVGRAAARWIGGIGSRGTGEGTVRLQDDVLLRFGIWAAVDTGRPLQVHTGFGDPDLDLHRADPLLLTGFLRATMGRCEVLLLHTYPFHRNAGYLAQMFPHVSLDVGLAVNYAGARATDVIAASLELAPFTKVLFSSDAWGVPELHVLGAVLFRRGLSRVLGGWVTAGDWTLADALHVVDLVAADNARRIYGVG